MDAAATRRRARRALGALGGTVQDLRRLSGGASRVTRPFDLELARAARAGALILQQDRGDGRPRAAAADAEAAPVAGGRATPVSPCPGRVPCGAGSTTGSGAGWLVVERLEGETIPRKILRDPEWSGRAGRSTRSARGPWRPSTP